MRRCRVAWKSVRRLLLLLAAGVFCLLSQSALAQMPDPNEIGTVYLGNGHLLSAQQPRLLTKNAHVADFLCAPTGTRIAYTSNVPRGDGYDNSLWITTTQDGDSTRYFSTHTPNDGKPSGVVNDPDLKGMVGWSDDAAYFAFAVNGYVPDDANPIKALYTEQIEIVDLVHGTVFTVPLPIQEIAPPDMAGSSSRPWPGSVFIWRAAWAPGRRLLAFDMWCDFETGTAFCFCLVDPDRRTTRLLVQSDDQDNDGALEGWVDSQHLCFMESNNYVIYDLVTGKSAPPQKDCPKIARSDDLDTGITTMLASVGKTLTLSESLQPADSEGNASASVENLWLTRTGGSPKPSRMQIDAFPPSLDYTDSEVQFLQNGGFDNGGAYHIVYVSEGDLKVVDLVPRNATPKEMLAAGEKLNCEMEALIVESNERQIGLAILQWVEENNETWPKADGLHDEIDQYLKDNSLFTAPNGAQFHYIQPEKPNLADMDDPASTALGEFDLPCGRVVLYADGHVRLEQPGQSGGSQ